FSQALDLLKPWDSMYHALGYSSILVMQATMTFEQRDIQAAMATIKDALQTCQRFRKRNSVVGSLSSLISKQANLQEGRFGNATVCYSGFSVLTFQDENMISFIKGGIKIRTSHQIYKKNKRFRLFLSQGLSERAVHHSGCGRSQAGHWMLSLLPQRVLRLLEFIGFSGNRRFGLSQLREGASNHSLRSILCAFTLLFYNTYVSLILGTGEGDLAEAEALLEPY
uniref:Tetratricopeptide repeat domain 39B n=1 Tax=Oryzias sinensis TaxID=183150 RepID=A0A8C7WRR4_9TELE